MDGGGLGAVSIGIPEWVVWLLVPFVVILVLFGTWKLFKFLWTLSA
jgi:hypothetical protein